MIKVNENENENIIDVILLGKNGVGKTCIIKSLNGENFYNNERSTIVPEFLTKLMIINGKIFYLRIWNLPGHEKFRSFTKLYYKKCKIVIFVYSITNRSSFEEINNWYISIKETLGNKAFLGLIGNKKDLFLYEEVEEREGKEKANEIGALFKLTSARTKDGIKDFFQSVLEEYLIKLAIDRRRVK